MRLEISFKALYNHRAVFDYFFRGQSERTLEELISRADENIQSILDAVDRYADEHDYNVDDIDEMFYEDSVEEIAWELGLILKEEEEE